MHEFAMVIPLILAFSFAGIEFCRSLRYSQLASSLSREGASIAYRECGSMSASDTASCLQGLQSSIQQFGTTLIPGTQLILSVYQYDDVAGAGEYSRVGISPVSATDGTSGITQTRYTIPLGVPIDGVAGSLRGSSMSGNIDPTILKKHRTMVISEVYVPFSSIVGGVLSLFRFDPGGFYDVTIL